MSEPPVFEVARLGHPERIDVHDGELASVGDGDGKAPGLEGAAVVAPLHNGAIMRVGPHDGGEPDANAVAVDDAFGEDAIATGPGRGQPAEPGHGESSSSGKAEGHDGRG
jgi:hypothetical protein